MGFFRRKYDEDNPHPFRFNNEDDTVDVELFKDIYEEATNLYGTDVVYIPVEHFQIEDTFGEYLSESLQKGVPMRSFVEQTEGWEGISDIYSKFGLRNQEDMSFHIGKNVIAEYEIEPKAGDIIYMVTTKQLWEIESLSDDKSPSFHPLGKFISWTFFCKAYVFDHADASEEFLTDENEDMQLLKSQLFNDSTAVEDNIDVIDVTDKNEFIEEIKGEFIDDEESDPLG
jgi:hypothetical protein